MAEVRGLAESLIGLARTLASAGDIDAVLHDVAARVGRLLGLSGAAVVVNDGMGPRPVGDPAGSAALAAIEAGVGDGPALLATRTAAIVIVRSPDELVVRWPAYAAAARKSGIGSVVALPLGTGVGLGALELHAAEGHPWAFEELEAATVYAELATSYLMRARALEQEQVAVRQLSTALSSRVILEQAKGIIVADLGIGADEAFELLRGYARSRGALLQTVAGAVVNDGLRPGRDS